MKETFVYIIIFFIVSAVVAIAQTPILTAYIFPDMVWVTDERASEYIIDMTGALYVVILNDDGNNNPIVHDISDVTFDIELYFPDEVIRRQFRCTDGFWRELICRPYSN